MFFFKIIPIERAFACSWRTSTRRVTYSALQNQEGEKIDWGSDNTSPNSVQDSKLSDEQRDGEEEDEQRDEEQVDDEKKQPEEPKQIDDLELKIE